MSSSGSLVDNVEVPSNPDAKLTLEGVVTDGWRQNTSIGNAPISNVTLHLKVGKRSDPATRNNSDYMTLTTGVDGRFQFSNLPAGVYTIFWDVPAHYYHEMDYAAEFTSGVVSETRDISQYIWVTRHGVNYRCMDHNYQPMPAGLTARLYETISARSSTKTSGVALMSTATSEDGYVYLDTADLAGSGGGLIELSDSVGQVVGRILLDQVNHQALSGGGICE